MRTLTLVFFLIFCNLIFGQSWQNISPTNVTGDITSVFFINEDIGFVIDGSIYKTTDGGSTWVSKSADGGYKRDIYFINSTTGYACGDQGAIVKTTDAGETWAQCTTGASLPFYSICFPSLSVGFAACNDGKVYKTTDAGSSWIAYSASTSIKNVFFITESIGFSASTTSVYKSTDGGATWSYNAQGGTYASIYFKDAEKGYISGIGYGYRQTANTGTTWAYQDIAAANSNKIMNLDFYGSNNGIAVGNNGIIISTTDGGTNWTTASSVTTNELLDVDFVSNNVAYAAGRSGTILKFSDNSGVENLNSKSIIATNNAPNPFNKSTVINYTLNKSQDIKIEVYNILGKKITTLFEGKKPIGEYQITFDATNYKSGMYFYSIISNDYTITKKMLIEK
ncbi:MAG TPA: hypothetical protein DDX39_07495 [Bacteroidales bacterium]|nr:MAG: hypothetical protein A2W98_02140 [Bacteroidetes bacterium GWF2_33_38]OFY73320.1 MAG: hypothetical protein A2265_02660 [Bacteroidetes bacterium RIFOXYA12_FULL_33_9]OFY89675.1 MAG: hypothetical protein A2236_08020 [Bacteroidetes bacterium RIFOXYA2_FULL_33_7]HBF88468.1 hypothetical protein [Bacteroidales bacterium]